MAGSKKVTVGYKYYLGAHMAICQGPIDSLSRIQVDRKTAWCGEADIQTNFIEINEPFLFGGDGREGGIIGKVDIIFGVDTQPRNLYLQSQLGDDIPSFRGVFSVVLNQVYVGNNPYLKPWAFRVQRINTTGTGGGQWQQNLAECVDPDAKSSFDCASLTELINAGDGDPNTIGAQLGLDSAQPAFSFLIPSAFSSLSLGVYRVTGAEITDWVTDYDAVVNPYAATLEGYTDCDGNIPQWCVDISATPPGGFDAAIADVSYDSINKDTHTMSTVVTPSGGDGAMGMNRWFRRQIVGTIIGSRSASAANTLDQWVYSGRIGGATEQLGTRFTLFSQVLNGGAQTDSETTTFDVPYIEPGVACYVQVTHNWSRREYSRAEFNASASAPFPLYDVYDCYLNMSTYVCVTISGVGVYEKTSAREYYAGQVQTLTGNPAPVGLNDQSTGASVFTGYPSILNSGTVLVFAYTFGRYNVTTSTTNEGSDTPTCEAIFKSPADGGCGPCRDMNPAHIIRECLTDTNWGMGYAETDIDETSFAAAAQTLFDEGLCISLLWDREVTIEDFVGEVLRHVDAVLYVSRRSGKFVLNLIRDDADSNTLILDESNVSGVEDVRRPTLSELTNTLSIVYWDMGEDVQESLTVHNEALRQIQGQEISTTIQYPGFTKRDLAARVALRDLRQLSTPLLTCELKASREAQALNIGDPFYLDWPDLEINMLLMRVDEIDYGDGIDNSVTIMAIEDTFGVPTTATTSPQPPLWVDPGLAEATPAQPRLVTEAPYYALAQTQGQLDTDIALLDNADLGYLMVAGGRQNAEFIANVYTDDGSGYSLSVVADFAPWAYTADALTEVTTSVDASSSKDLSIATAGTLAYINDEIVQVSAIDEDSSGIYTLTLVRGCLDTVPVKHGAGSAIILWEEFAESSETQYVRGEEVSAKFLTTTEQDQLTLAEAPEDSMQLDSRAIRQFAPGNLRIDGLYYPQSYTWTGTHTLTWNRRSNVVLAFGGVFGHAETGDVSSASDSQTYVVEVWVLMDTTSASYDYEKIFEKNVGDVVTYDLDVSSVDGDSVDSNYMDVPEGARAVEVRVTAVQDGYRSWQSATVSLQVPPYTDSIGDSNA